MPRNLVAALVGDVAPIDVAEVLERLPVNWACTACTLWQRVMMAEWRNACSA